MTDTKTVNNIEYTFDTATQKITWKQDEMNYEIHLFYFAKDNNLNKAICEYSGSKTNYDLLLAVGKTPEEAGQIKEVINIPEFRSKESYDTVNSAITETAIKRFMGLISKKHLNFEMYDLNGELVV